MDKQSERNERERNKVIENVYTELQFLTEPTEQKRKQQLTLITGTKRLCFV